MLLIIFYGEFCSFHRPVMLILESQLNHDLFKLKSELHIKNWNREENKQCKEEITQPWQFRKATNFYSLQTWLLLGFFVLFLISSKIVPL